MLYKIFGCKILDSNYKMFNLLYQFVNICCYKWYKRWKMSIGQLTPISWSTCPILWGKMTNLQVDLKISYHFRTMTYLKSRSHFINLVCILKYSHTIPYFISHEKIQTVSQVIQLTSSSPNLYVSRDNSRILVSCAIFEGCAPYRYIVWVIYICPKQKHGYRLFCRKSKSVVVTFYLKTGVYLYVESVSTKHFDSHSLILNASATN